MSHDAYEGAPTLGCNDNDVFEEFEDSLKCGEHPDPWVLVRDSRVEDRASLAVKVARVYWEALKASGASSGSREHGATPFDYQLIEQIGRGSFGIVHKAIDLRNDGRVVAIKFLTLGASALDETRFRAEGKTLGPLQHPNIVQIYDKGVRHGRPFLVLEYCEGGDLAGAIQTKRYAPMEAAHIVEDLARAIYLAHMNGIIHRDLKPANILLAADGTPKVTDFGLAKRHAGTQRDIASQTGAIIGTTAYMSPEQARGRGKQATEATDVYSLGTILYELLTGTRPFSGEPEEVRLKIINDDPLPIRQLRPEAPRDLETICFHCMRKDPNKRYRSALELADDLRRVQNGEPPGAARRPRILERCVLAAKRHPVKAVLAAALVVTLSIHAVAMHLLLSAAQRSEWAAQKSEDLASRRLEQNRKAISIIGHSWWNLDPLANPGRSRRDVWLEVARNAENELGTLDDPRTRGHLLRDVGSLYVTFADYPAAIRLLTEAVDVLGAEYDARHDDVLTAQSRLAQAYNLSGSRSDRENALALHLDILAKGSPEQVKLLSTKRGIAFDYMELGEPGRAIPFLLEYLDEQQKNKNLGEQHVDTLETRRTLADAYFRAGQRDKSIQHYQRVCSAFAKHHPDKNSNHTLLRTQTSLGILLLIEKRPSEAESVLRCCLSVRKAHVHDWEMYQTMCSLGVCLLDQNKDLEEAGTLLEDGINGMTKRKDSLPPYSLRRITECFEHLVRFYEATEEADKAEKTRKRLDDWRAYLAASR